MSTADEIEINHLKQQIQLFRKQLIAVKQAQLLDQNPEAPALLELKAADLDAKLRKAEQELISRYTAYQEPNCQLVLAALEQDRVAAQDAQQLVAALQTSIRLAEAAGKLENTSLAVPTQQVIEIFDDPKFDFKHKLKAGIPLIPGFLSYEVELGVGSGLSLTTLWENFVSKFRGGQPPQRPT